MRIHGSRLEVPTAGGNGLKRVLMLRGVEQVQALSLPLCLSLSLCIVSRPPARDVCGLGAVGA